MLNLRRILFPTDFSACAEHAFSHAAWLSATLGAELYALHVRLPDFEDAPDAEPADFLPGGGRGDVALYQDAVTADSPQQGILTYAEEHDVDLIVMGTHGRSGVQRLILGSVAEAVLRRAPCPVLIVPEQAPPSTVARVLAPVDFSSFAHPALAHAKALASLYDAPLDVLHVVQETTMPVAYGLDPVVLATPEMIGRARVALEGLVAEVPGPEVDTTCHVVVGFAATEIIHFAEEHEVDLVVIATHGSTGLEHFLLGSVTEKVIRRASCPVFTVRCFGRALTETP